MAKGNIRSNRAKLNNRRLMRELSIRVQGDSEVMDSEFWDNYEPIEPVHRTHYELSD